MSGREVRAGGAYVEILAKANVAAGLKAAGGQIKQWGAGLAGAGAAMVGAAGGILAPLAAMAMEFADAGSAIDDMAQRTGMTAAAISSLGYAAQMGGTDVETLEKATQKVAQNLADAANGAQGAQDKFAALGVDWKQLQAASPDEWLAIIADGLAEVDDPAQRTALAMDLLGKSGTALLPMLSGGAAGLEEMAAEADRLGLVMSGSDAAAAAELGDNMDRLTLTLKAARLQIGAALAPALSDLYERGANLGAAVAAWTKQNRGLFVGLAAGAATVAAVGGSLLALGAAVSVAGFAVAGLGSLASLAAAALAALLSPVGLITAGLAAGAYAWAAYTTAGQNATAATKAALGDLAATGQQTLGGLADALATGDLGAAADIALAGLRVAWVRGLQLVEQLTGSRVATLLELLGGGRFGDAAAFAWQEVKAAAQIELANLQAELATVAAGIAELWDSMATSLKSTWRAAIYWVADKLLVLTDRAADITAKLAEALNSDKLKKMAEEIRLGPAVRTALAEDEQRETKQRAADKEARTQQRGAALAAQLADIEKDKAAIAARRSALEDDLAATLEGRGADTLAAAQQSLDEATAAAKAKRDQAAADRAAADAAKAQTGGPAEDTAGAFGTFSAAAAVALGQGTRDQQKAIAENTADTVAAVDNLTRIVAGNVAALAAEQSPLTADILRSATAYAATPAATLEALRPGSAPTINGQANALEDSVLVAQIATNTANTVNGLAALLRVLPNVAPANRWK